jgi:hypothetical protein
MALRVALWVNSGIRSQWEWWINRILSDCESHEMSPQWHIVRNMNERSFDQIQINTFLPTTQDEFNHQTHTIKRHQTTNVTESVEFSSGRYGISEWSRGATNKMLREKLKCHDGMWRQEWYIIRGVLTKL